MKFKLCLRILAYLLIFSSAQAADIETIIMPTELPTDGEKAYLLDLNAAVKTANGNILGQRRDLYFDVQLSQPAADLAVRIAFSPSIAWSSNNAALLFEEGYQPGISPTALSYDLNNDELIEVLDVGFLEIFQPDLLVFDLDVLTQEATNIRLLLAAHPKDYITENGVIADAGGHPKFKIISTDQPGTIIFSVHQGLPAARANENPIFTKIVDLVDFIPQFDFTVTRNSIAILDAAATPANSLFIADEFTSPTQTNIDYEVVNNFIEIEDNFNISDGDMLRMELVGNMEGISGVSLDYCEELAVPFNLRPDLAIIEVPLNDFFANCLDINDGKINIHIDKALALDNASYSLHTKLILLQYGIVLEDTMLEAFEFVRSDMGAIFHSEPNTGSQIQISSPIASSNTSNIVFTNQGDTEFSINLVDSLPQGPFNFSADYNVILQPGQSDTFRVQCSPLQEVNQPLEIYFALSTEPNLVNYILNCIGESSEPLPAPRLRISIDGVSIPENHNLDFGITNLAQPRSIELILHNTGNADLNLAAPILPLGFSAVVPKLQLLPGETMTVQLVLAAEIAGKFDGILQLLSNDPIAYNLSLSGEVLADSPPDKPAPKLQISIDGVPIQDNKTVDFGVTNLTQPSSIAIVLQNTGDANLDLVPPIFPLGFNAVVPKLQLLPGESMTVQLVLRANIAGKFSGTLQLLSNDTSQNELFLIGEVLPGDLEEILKDMNITSEELFREVAIEGLVESNGTVCDSVIRVDSELRGGKVCGEIQNNGIVRDVDIMPEAGITGGLLSGTVLNEGKLCSIGLDSNARVVGGTLDCTINGQRNAPAIIAQAQVLAETKLHNVCLTPSVKLPSQDVIGNNVKLPRKYDNPDVQDYCIQPEQIADYLPRDILGTDPEAFALFFKSEVELIDAQAMSGIRPEHLENIKPKALSAVNKLQFNAIPLTSLTGLRAENLAGLNAGVLQNLEPEHITALDSGEIAKLSDWGRSRYLTNINPDKLKPENIELFLQEGWLLKENGELSAPPGANITLPSLTLPVDFPDKIKFDYELLDFKRGFGLSGKGGAVLADLQAVLHSIDANLAINQREDGLLIVSDNLGNQLALLADLANYVQLDENANRGVFLEPASGHWTIITDKKHKIKLIPAPKDYYKLAASLDGSEARCNSKGDVLLQLPTNNTRNANNEYVAIVFDGLVTTDTRPAGIYFDNTTTRSNLNIREARVVYADGTAQNAYATVTLPEVFINLALQINGVENVILNVDGSFSVVFLGQNYTLMPTFDTVTQHLEAGVRIAAELTANADGSIAYSVQDGDLFITFRRIEIRAG
jgi:hypothetical protein